MKAIEGFSIREAARRCGLSAHTLRYYERIGLIHRIARARGGQRRYTEDDAGWIAFLHKLRATGMNIRQMRAYAALQRRGEATLEERVAMLEDLRVRVEARVAELSENLKLVRHKIEVYGAAAAERRSAPRRRTGGGR